MKPEEIKVGTQFIYKGNGFYHHQGVIQTITNIEHGCIYSDFHETGYTYKFYFHINSPYMKDCEVLNPSEPSFSVHSYSLLDKSNKVSHWSDGLNMIITKDNVTIELTEDEIRQLVATLPRTFGGSY